MATVTDNFNRADGALGANWAAIPAHSALTIVSDTCRASATSTFCAQIWDADAFSSDQYSAATIGTASTSGAEAVGVIVRAKTGVDEFYLGFVTSANWQIYLRLGGLYTLLASGASASSPGDVIKLEVIGNDLTLYKNGGVITIFTATGGQIITGGKPGILIFDTGNSLSVDDWESVTNSVSVNLTGVTASPAIGNGTVQITIPIRHHATDGGRPLRPRTSSRIKSDGVPASPEVGFPRITIGSIVKASSCPAAMPEIGEVSTSIHSNISVMFKHSYAIRSQINITLDGQPMPSAMLVTGTGSITTEVDFFPEELAALLQ